MSHIDIGAVCEYAFASELLSRGITPNWPSTETGAYDMIADAEKGLYRIQVKGTQSKGPKVRMCIQRRQGKANRPRGYNVEEVDFIVIHLFEYALWYIVPVDKIIKDIVIKPEDPACRWHRYKNAWHLLK